MTVLTDKAVVGRARDRRYRLRLHAARNLEPPAHEVASKILHRFMDLREQMDLVFMMDVLLCDDIQTSIMQSDRTLKNAPLIEVIAEVHWKLASSTAGRPYDPNWFKIAAEVENAITPHLPLMEELQPAGASIPLDVLGRSPILRFRPKGGGWPLVQFGQGIMTINATPPYDGWEAIRSLLKFVIDDVANTSPSFASVVPERFQLTYRDAFTAQHGIEDTDSFLFDFAPIANRKGAELLNAAGCIGSTAVSCEIKGEVQSLPNAFAAIRGAKGNINASSDPTEAAILDFVVSGPAFGQQLEAAKIIDWFDEAHRIAWSMFSNILPIDFMNKLKGQ